MAFETSDISQNYNTPLYIKVEPDLLNINSKIKQVVENIEDDLPIIGQRADGALKEHVFFESQIEEILFLKSKILTRVSELHEFYGEDNTSYSDDTTHISGWPLICYDAGFVPPHCHPNSLWSGVYYVEIEYKNERRSGVLELIDPRAGVDYWVAAGRPFSRSLFIKPKNGMLVIFPSYLRHLVHPNIGDAKRVSIPFNVQYHL